MKKDNNVGIIKNDDQKSLIIEKLADSYLQGNFDIAREYFKPEGSIILMILNMMLMAL